MKRFVKIQLIVIFGSVIASAVSVSSKMVGNRKWKVNHDQKIT